MAHFDREYELVLMLDPKVADPARDQLADQVRSRIGESGELRHESRWGVRKMAFEIDNCTEADYRWFRFTAPPETLEQINHDIKIADGILRSRIFEVDPSSPVVTSPPPVGSPAPAPEEEEKESVAEEV